MQFLGNYLALRASRRICQLSTKFFCHRLKNPVFVLGFNNSGKSSAVTLLSELDDLCIYPGEGNAELWFREHFPWIDSRVSVPPVWVEPEEFIRSVKDTCGSSFEHSRAQLGAYQWLIGGNNLINDSGMLAALAPDITTQFPDAKFIHFIRDGRLASYITARLEWSRIIRSPGKYIDYNCPLKFTDVLKKMAEYWVWTMNRMEEASSLIPGSVLELRYEDWWSCPEPMVSSVAHFIGVSERKTVKGYANKVDLTELLLSEISTDELEILEAILGPMMRQKGYPRLVS